MIFVGVDDGIEKRESQFGQTAHSPTQHSQQLIECKIDTNDRDHRERHLNVQCLNIECCQSHESIETHNVCK